MTLKIVPLDNDIVTLITIYITGKFRQELSHSRKWTQFELKKRKVDVKNVR
jgi:hypothetical protein